MDRLTNLILRLDLIDGQAGEVSTPEGIWNRWYRIMLTCIAAPAPECSKGTSTLCNIAWNRKTRKGPTDNLNIIIMMISLITLYLTSVNGNVDM